MSLLASLVGNIASEGERLESFLGNDSPSLCETTGWKYDEELLPREAWEASQSLLSDCQQLIALLMPKKLKLMYESISNNAAVALGVACDLKVAEKIAENGGEIKLSELAKVCETNHHKLGKVPHRPQQCWVLTLLVQGVPCESSPTVIFSPRLLQKYSETTATVQN
ncbi:uncharacterized protein HMPREF1541_05258 [Cyphellophora europaea CBS 101466]|uniref:O-methyltransferase domain-containing protein n=1 Tax=Cyphellophora europaea (strain CBS 101466) TaxID=1220924 RepID=W2RYY2_CYPE1|nr:uncharacterized protein HMPREF1541_05258 [Cyphellophora europaea CBS 101466]ETN40978.1 hypothetical protein HMPREF1541_05258 [Cyphellophora europaea CBS 101466]